MRLGIFDHFGWAIVVTIDEGHRVVDRRRIALVEPGVCEAPIHYEGKRLGEAGTAALIAEVRASAARTVASELDVVASAAGAPIVSIALRTWSLDFPRDVPTQLRVPYESRADAIMYRQVHAGAAESRGWHVHIYRAEDVIGHASALLGPRASEVIDGPRAKLGPPWSKDHRVALAAAVLSS